jgi:NADH-quinone oxidoreductase subunit J
MLNFLDLNYNIQNFYITSDFFIIATSYGCLIASAILTIVSVNPIHALINLITTFFTATIIIFLLNLIFFALILLAVYLGAIAVLFLFMIIMLDIKPTSEYSEIKSA